MARTRRAASTEAEIRFSDVDEFRNHGTELFPEHFDEVCLDKEQMRLDPNWRDYYALEERGVLMAIAAWIGERMVGYSVNSASMHLYDRELMVINCLALFVAKTHRRGGLGLHLIRETIELAKERAGTSRAVMTFHHTPKSPLGRILEREGFRDQNIVKSRFL